LEKSVPNGILIYYIPSKCNKSILKRTSKHSNIIIIIYVRSNTCSKNYICCD